MNWHNNRSSQGGGDRAPPEGGAPADTPGATGRDPAGRQDGAGQRPGTGAVAEQLHRGERSNLGFVASSFALKAPNQLSILSK